MSQNAMTAARPLTVHMRYFAAAAEAAGMNEEQLNLAEPTLAGLREELSQRYGAAMATVLRAGSFLVDGQVRRDSGAIVEIVDGAPSPESSTRPVTVDVLPPFAGG